MRFAWQNYRRYAMGKNELRPLTKDGYEGNMFGELTQTLGHPVQRHFGLPFSGSTQRTQVLLSTPTTLHPSSRAWEGEDGERQGLETRPRKIW